MQNIDKIESSVRFHNYKIAKSPILRIFIDAYFKFYNDEFNQFELFHQYSFGKEYNTDDYTLSKNSIKKPEMYWFKPETFVGYRYYKDRFVPFFLNLTEDYKDKNLYTVNGFSTYDENKYFFHYKDVGEIEDKQVMISKFADRSPDGENYSLYDNIKQISDITEKAYFKKEI